MKVKNLLKITALALFIALPLSCVEPEEPTELPPETQKGANTFGCLVNGELFVAQPHFVWFGQPYVHAVYFVDLKGNSGLTIKGSNSNGFIEFGLTNSESEKLITPSISYYQDNANRFQIRNTGEVFLTKLDLENRIVSGTFEFEIPLLKDDETVEEITVKITEGRFDIKLE